MVGIVLLGVFVLLLALGAPIAVCLGMSSVSAILVQGAGKPLEAIMSVLPRLCSSASSKFVLLAIPFFILSGNVMEKAGISGRLINLAEKCLGHIRGGMAMVCVVVSCFFAAISGSGPATVAALGLIMIPALVKAGYPASFSCALMAAGGAIGVVIPPSITFVVYGSIADASITDLFVAGVVPGLLMGLGLIVAAMLMGRKMDLKVLPKAGGKERLAAFKDAFWGLLMPVIILGGIYAGICTPVEASVVAVWYALFVGFFITKKLSLKEVFNAMKLANISTGTILIVVGVSTIFGRFLTMYQIPQQLAAQLGRVVHADAHPAFQPGADLHDLALAHLAQGLAQPRRQRRHHAGKDDRRDLLRLRPVQRQHVYDFVQELITAQRRVRKQPRRKHQLAVRRIPAKRNIGVADIQCQDHDRTSFQVCCLYTIIIR